LQKSFGSGSRHKVKVAAALLGVGFLAFIAFLNLDYINLYESV